MIPPQLWNCTNDEYHADTRRIGHSMLHTFRESPNLYRALYADCTMEKPGTTDAMEMGSALHCLLLEPGEFPVRYKDGIPCALKTEKARIAKQGEMMDQVRAMARAAMDHPRASQLLEAPGEIESAYTWEDAETGVPLKCRFDKWLRESRVLVDVKTAANPTPGWGYGEFYRSAITYDYPLQAALYSECVELLTGDVPIFCWLVVGKEDPHDVWTPAVLPNSEPMMHGQRELRSTLRRLARCYDSGVWLAPGQDSFLEWSDLPKWVS